MLLKHSIVKKTLDKDCPQGFLWGNNGIFRSVERTEFQALEQFPEPASIEIHSHGSMGAFFSSTDDAEETGCRISSVIGRNSDRLEIISRVCVHGLFAFIDSSLIYEGVEAFCHVKYS